MAFDGTDKDTNFWDETVSGTGTTGSITQDEGAIHLQTSASADGVSRYRTVRKARFVAGSAQLFQAAVNFETTATADNVRRIGAFTGTEGVDGEGFFFELDGTVFSIGTRTGGTDSLISSGSFNGNLGSVWTPTAGTHYKLTIEFTPLGAFWYVGARLLHKIQSARLSNTLTLPVTIENRNEGSTTDVEFECDGAYIARQGELITNPTSKFIPSAAVPSTTICKYGAGTLKGIVLSEIESTGVVNIYDGITTGGTLIWSSGSLPAKQEPIDIAFYNIPFSDGLTINITTDPVAVLVAYE